MRRSLIALAAAMLVGLALTAAGHAAVRQPAAVRACGLTSRIDGVRYDVRETKGTVPCPTVKRVMSTFLRSGTASSPWTCFRGHGSSPYAASCAKGKGVVVRAYSPS